MGDFFLSTSVLANSSRDVEDAKKEYDRGVRLLTLGKPSKAIPFLEKALELNSEMEEAKSALSEAKSGLIWSSPRFCSKCQKLLEPVSEYPHTKYEDFCPRCGEIQGFDKEALIGIVEIFTKLVFFGVYIVAVLFFLAMPDFQLVSTIWILAWNRLADGVFLAMSFIPMVIAFFVLTNDPWGNSLSFINFAVFDPLRSNPPLYLAASILLLVASVYLYFFFMLTPFLAVHRKGMWVTARHQKKILICTSVFCGFVIAVRMVNGVFY